MIPSDWQLCTVDELCHSVSVGIVIKPTQYYVDSENGIRAFRSANVREGRINDTDWVYISKTGDEKYKKSRLQEGDILVVRTGYPGTACVVTKEFENCNAIDIVIARPNQDKVIPYYLCAFTNSEYGKSQVLNLQGGMAQKHLNVGEYKSVLVKLPSKKEQNKIAKILSTWDKAIDVVEKLIENSRAQKKSLMQKLLTGEKRLPGFRKQWNRYKLGELFRERSEKNRIDLPLLSITRDQGVISRGEVGRKDTSSEDKGKYKRMRIGDIGYNTMRMWQGVSALSDKDGIVSPAYTIVTPKEEVNAEYMSYLFKHPRTIHDFFRYSQGLVSDTWNLKYRQFSQVTVSIPEIREQEKISEILRKNDTAINLLIKKKNRLVQEKKSLMQQLLTGKRRVNLD